MALVAVIGAGITGLSAASSLQSVGVTVDVLEKEAQVGGVIQTAKHGKSIYDLGANSLHVYNKTVKGFVEGLGLEDKKIVVDGQAARYVVKNGELVELPMSPKSFLKTSLLTGRGKMRVLKDLFTFKKVNREESIGGFVRRHLGDEVMDNMIDPFVSGVYAGDPEKLSVKHALPKMYKLGATNGSVIRGALFGKKNPDKVKTEIMSFGGGMSTMMNAISDQLGDSVKLGVTITGIRRNETKWELEWSINGKAERRIYDEVIITTPIGALRKLPLDTEVLEAVKDLEEIEYVPMAMVTMGIPKTQIKHSLKGFGFLIPSKEKLKTLGTLFVSSMFPSHAEDGQELLTTFIGGSRGRKLYQENDEALISMTCNDMEKLGVIEGEPSWAQVHRWDQAIPQYTLGYDKYLDVMKKIEDQFAGLHLAGNYRGGVGLPNCIENGINLAETILNKEQ